MSELKRYVLIQPDEDGNPIRWLKHEQVGDIAALMEDYGIKQFLDAVPGNNDDPNYWNSGDAMLLEVRVVKVRPKDVITQWVLE